MDPRVCEFTTRRVLACGQYLATGENYVLREDIGGPEGIRTPDLQTASLSRSQLRHGPTPRQVCS